MSIEAIKLNHFQVHSSLEIPLDPRITTIKGPTDVGKSAIVRALRWVCQNHLGGEEFIQEGKKQTSVSLVVEGQKITRCKGRGASLNTYSLGDRTFKSFGVSVPQDIAQLLNIADINFQDQHDAPFWFSETGGEVSRKLNAIIDLSIIDHSLNKVATSVRWAQERKMLCEERLKEAKEELKEARLQEPRIKEFKILKETDLKVKHLGEDIQTLENLLNQIQNLATKELQNQAEEGQSVLTAANNWIKLHRRETSLNRLIQDAKRFQEQSKAPPNFSPVETAQKERKEAERKAGELEKLIIDIRRATTESIQTANRVDKIVSQFNRRIQGQKCPLCGKPL